MTNKQDELERVVLQAVANDYEDFATIVQDVARWMSKVWDVPDKKQIEQALMKAIADKVVNAYETSDELQRYIATQADPQKIDIHWFYITEQGRQRLRKLEDEEI